jgi:type IV secretory pathway component VirB8|nr:type IV secretion system protein [uncultured Dongia sp.]
MMPQLPRISGNLRQYDTGSAYNRVAAANRVLMSYSIIVTIAFVIAAATIWSLFPLKTIVPQFVYFSDKREQIVTVEPGRVSKDTADLLIEKQLKQLVQYRETINCIDEGDRYAWIQRVTDLQTFVAFKSMMDPNANAKSPIKSYCQNNMAREVYISAVYPNNYGAGIWTVDFVTTDRKVDEVIDRKDRIATIEFTISPLDTSPDRADENPIGMTVTGYQARDRAAEQPTDAKDAILTDEAQQ